MADKGMTLAIVLLVAGLIVGGGIGYFAAPTKIVEVQVINIPPSVNLPVSIMYSKTLTTSMSSVTQYSVGTYIIYVWQSGATVYWTYAKIGG